MPTLQSTDMNATDRSGLTLSDLTLIEETNDWKIPGGLINIDKVGRASDCCWPELFGRLGGGGGILTIQMKMIARAILSNHQDQVGRVLWDVSNVTEVREIHTGNHSQKDIPSLAPFFVCSWSYG